MNRVNRLRHRTFQIQKRRESESQSIIMFIKKDLRQIEEIIQSENEDRSVLQFSKRSSEFRGNLDLLLSEKQLSYLNEVKTLNLYDNALVTIDGIEKFRILSSLVELNLGCNQITSIPSHVSFNPTQTNQSNSKFQSNFCFFIFFFSFIDFQLAITSKALARR